MQSKLCLVLALVMLIGALAVGNPFLRTPAATPLRADEPSAPKLPAAAASRDAVEAPSGGASLVGLRTAGDAGSPLPLARPVPAAALRGMGTAGRTEPCPDAGLRPHVVEVRYLRNGEPVWVLRDGRMLRRNPLQGGSQPLLVPAKTE